MSDEKLPNVASAIQEPTTKISVKHEGEKQSAYSLALEKIVTNPDISPERLEKFLDLQTKMEDRQAQIAFNKALSNFQGECPILKKNKTVDFTAKSGNRTKYNYCPLEEIVRTVRPLLKKYGLSFSFDTDGGEHSSVLKTTISHLDGHSKTSNYSFPTLHDDTRMNGSQRRKSALTFAKRAGLESALGIITGESDDDARAASDNLDSSKNYDKLVAICAKSGPNFEQKLIGYINDRYGTMHEKISTFDGEQVNHSLEFLANLANQKKK